LPLQVIKFILQPVVENAVIHGFDEENGTIWIYGEREEDILKLYVKDNGKGIPPEVINKFSQSKDMHRDEKKLTGIGLANVNERIQVTYGEQFGIQIDRRLGEGTVVTYTLPAIEGSAKTIEEGHDR
jgi:two-component system sensor histidine kinase YesM